MKTLVYIMLIKNKEVDDSSIKQLSGPWAININDSSKAGSGKWRRLNFKLDHFRDCSPVSHVLMFRADTDSPKNDAQLKGQIINLSFLKD